MRTELCNIYMLSDVSYNEYGEPKAVETLLTQVPLTICVVSNNLTGALDWKDTYVNVIAPINTNLSIGSVIERSSGIRYRVLYAMESSASYNTYYAEMVK